MSIYGRLLKSIRADLSLTNPKAWNQSLWNLITSQAISGENVNEATALTYSAVWNAVVQISGALGSLPLHLMQQKGEKRKKATNRVMYRVMHDEWNPYMAAMTGREVFAAHLLTWGNGYAEKVVNGYGETIALWPITPNRVRPIIKDGKFQYAVRVDNEDHVLAREQVLHVPGLGFDGYMGYSVIGMARKSIGLGMAMETFGSLFFGQGTHPGVIVSHPTTLSAQGHKNLQTSLIEAYSGLGQAHRLMLLEEGMKVEKWGIPPNDCQFLESRQFQIPEIARWFNIPPHKIKDLTKSSFNNIEAENASFVIDCILPWCLRLEQNYSMQLLSPSDKNQSGNGALYWKHNVDGLLRGDTSSRGEYYTKMFNIGAMSVNDIREKEDLDPVVGGDKHFVPLNMQPIEDAGKPKPQPPEQGTLPGIDPKKKNGNGKDKDSEARTVSQ